MEGAISLGIYDRNGRLVRVLHKAATSDEFVVALDGFITHWDGLNDAGKAMPPGRYFARGYMVGDVKVQKVNFQSLAIIGSGSVVGSANTQKVGYQALAITGSGAFSAVSPRPELIGSEDEWHFKFDGQNFVPQKEIRVALVDNPLDRDRAGSADLAVGIEKDGSWLELADGLPLKQLSPMPSLKWAALGRMSAGKPLVVFQSDGSPLSVQGKPVFTFAGPVSFVETYSITNISDMMAFDCGGFDFAGVGKW